MSGSNALAAAKRRRVEGASKPSAPLARPNNSQQRPQSQPKPSNSATLPTGKVKPPVYNSGVTNSNTKTSQKSNIVLQKNQFSSSGMNQNVQNNRMSSDENSNNIFTIPTPPPGVNHLELLKVHHIFINKLASHLPPALETLGENFNIMSANCDNLNDRLEFLEKNGGASNGGASNGGASNGGASNVREINDFESEKKIEVLNTTITTLLKTFDELKNNFVKLQTYSIEKELENNKFKNDISSKNSELLKETENLRKQIIELQENVSELKTSKDVETQEQTQDELETQDNEKEKKKENKQELEQELEKELE
jgi:hypothetical protein